jgi:hypothetical protein
LSSINNKNGKYAYIVDCRAFKYDFGCADQFQFFSRKQTESGQGRHCLQNFGPVSINWTFQPEPVNSFRFFCLPATKT